MVPPGAVDTHMHVYHAEVPPQPGGPSLPGDFREENYRAMRDALGFQPFVSAPTGDADDDKEAAGNDIVAVALPQLFELFATNFFVDFMKDIAHTLPRPNPRL